MSLSGQRRDTVRHTADRRVSRTRRSIDAAFLALLQRRGYDGVAVSDIVREADVGRATFYEHYTSKDDLLRSQLRQVAGSLLQAAPGPTTLLDATPLFAHVRDVPMLYRLLAGRSAGARAQRVLQQALEERASAVLADGLKAGASLRAPLTPPVACRLIVANLLSLLGWWAETGMQPSAADMQALFQSSVGWLVPPDRA